MTEIEHRSICDGVSFRSVRDTRFKTMRIAVNFMLPLEKDQTAANALLPFLLSRASREYPDFTKLGEKLSELYGAELVADVQKMGDVQVLGISAVGIADRYALDGESISGELSRLLCSVIFDPPFENGLFPEEGFRQEQRQTIEMIDAEYNDKRTYARLRCEEIMCKEEPYGISRYGSRDDIVSMRRETLTDAWKHLMSRARIEIMALGDCEPEPIFAGFRDAFCAVSRDYHAIGTGKAFSAGSEVKLFEEKMDVAQSKLVMGFRTGAESDEESMHTRLMTALFGGTPHSKLFLNVREKLSLCYYCSARYNSHKGIILVESGVETENIERAREEILRQLEEVKNGNFDAEELNSAKLSLCNNYRTIGDYLGALENWYVSQVFHETIRTPEEAAECINGIAREQVIQAARRVKLDTEYRLVGSGEVEK